MNKKPEISILIVHYRNEPDLIECLNSIYEFKPKASFEIILVDNSERKTITNKLNKFKFIKYIPSAKNLGYGVGMNLAASYAKGEFLFILNPDVVFTKNIIDPLLKKIFGSKQMGIIAPLLYSPQGKILEQGAKEINIKNIIFKYSFIDKIWPRNPISENYWINKWDKNLQKVDNVPGTAFIIRNELFKKIGGFDSNFFLYFEEFDLCKRIRDLGYKIYIDPVSPLIHKWGTTTRQLSNKNEIFKKSRFYYFKKHFGLLLASVLTAFLNFTPKNILFIAVAVSALLIRLYNISASIPLTIGDQGWFYISARDLLIGTNFPLVGITSSHLWLHQGPLWTYVLAVVFAAANFNPLAPAIFTVLLDILTLISVYLLTSKIFNKNIALFASIIYALSPYVILASRTPYHTSFIPILVMLLFYCLTKWVKNNMSIYFPLSLLLISLLYNFELQTSVLFFLVLITLIYGFIKKTPWFKEILSNKILFYSFLAFFIPMSPVILYDLGHGFPQTIVFAGWIGYKAFSFLLNIFSSHSTSSVNEYLTLGKYFISFFQKLVFIPNAILAFSVISISFPFLIYKNFQIYVKKSGDISYQILLILIIFLLGGIIIGKTPSDAYLYSIIIPFIIMISIFLNKISKVKYGFAAVLLILFLISFFNVINVLSSNYYLVKSSPQNGEFNRFDSSRYMVKNAYGQVFRIVGKGPGSKFQSFTAPYEFFSWYLGGRINKQAKLTYVLYESNRGVKIIISK